MADSGVAALRRQIAERAAKLEEQEREAEARRAAEAQKRTQASGSDRQTVSERVPLLPERRRQNVRRHVEELPGVAQFAMEMTPATLGTVIGGGLGSVAGPFGTMAGAAAGGTLGEFLGQESGFSPQSDLNLGIAAGAPVVGPAVGSAARLTRRGVSKGVGMLPPARSAMGETVRRQTAEAFQQARRRILSARPSGMTPELDQAVAKLEGGIADALKPVSGSVGQKELDVSKLRNWLSKVTDPKHKDFDANMAAELKGDLQVIDRILAKAQEFGTTKGPGGPGSLVVRSGTAGAGASLGGPIGAVVGAHAPEIVAGVLVHPVGRQILERTLGMGKQPINMNRWATIFQALSGPIREENGPIR